MSLKSLFGDLTERLRFAEFLLDAVHHDHPTAFTRQRKLPLPTLVALLLSGIRKSIQGELDEFFARGRSCTSVPFLAVSCRSDGISAYNSSYSSILRFKNQPVRDVFSARPAGVSN